MKKTTRWSALLGVVFLFGCAGQTSKVQPAGFLKNYSILKERRDQPRLFYVHPTVDFNKYDKILLEPVTVWATEGNNLSEVPREDLNRLAGLLHQSIKQEIEKRGKRTIVTSPGPGVIRCRFAITEASTASAVNVVATILPQMVIVTEGISLVSGTRAFAGTASIEGEVTDAMTGELLMAAVDRRQGGRDFGTGWSHVEAAFKHWAEEIAKDLSDNPRR